MIYTRHCCPLSAVRCLTVIRDTQRIAYSNCQECDGVFIQMEWWNTRIITQSVVSSEALTRQSNLIQIVICSELMMMFFSPLKLSYLFFLILSNSWPSGSTLLLSKLEPGEIAILQYDSRPLADYWLASALLNKLYCDKHNHVFIFYSAVDCHYDAHTQLASPWCKVKAMKQVL